jgi:hypothetical protein
MHWSQFSIYNNNSHYFLLIGYKILKGLSAFTVNLQDTHKKYKLSCHMHYEHLYSKIYCMPENVDKVSGSLP